MTLRGLHWRNVNELAEGAFSIASSFQSYVVLSNAGPALPLAIRERFPDALIISRLYWPAGELLSPEDFVGIMAPYIEATRGVTLFYQILNEPNKEYPSVSAEEFAMWMISTLALLRERFPDCKFGFPMPEVTGEDSWQYAVKCSVAVEACDFIAEHCYWQGLWQMDDWNWGSRYFRCAQQWPGKPIHITEFGCSLELDEAERIRQYRHYLDSLPEYVGSASVFWMAGGDGWPQLWVNENIGKGITLPSVLTPLESHPGAPTNGEGEGMVTEYNRARIWQDYQAVIEGTPMFQKVRAANPDLGDALGPERDYGDVRVQFYAGGIIWARVGDWENTQIARSKDEFPLE